MPHHVPHHGPESGPKPDAGASRTHHGAHAQALWELLREHRCDGFRFRRQVTVFGGFAEFYCAAAKLVVQLAGASRRGHKRQDARNHEALAGGGLRVLRVPASLVGRDPRTAGRLVADALMESGHAPGPRRISRHHFGPGPVGDTW